MTNAALQVSDPPTSETRFVDTLIVGAGLFGICTAVKLMAAGERDILVIERGSTYGGTWRDNRYPGCACDIPSPVYSYAFSPNPEWTRFFARQPEIQRYILRLAEEHDLGEVTEFETELLQARWSEDDQGWRVTTNRGPITCRYLIIATGLYPELTFPDIPGIAEFGGTWFHSARWDHSYDLRGKRVAVVGTGASAIQLIPEIQPLVEHLTVCQRTPTWVVPKFDPSFGPRAHRRFKRHPWTLQALTWVTLVGMEVMMATARYTAVLGPLEALGRWNLKRGIPDPDLRSRLTPNFRLGCKRVTASNTYYPALVAPNVEVAPAAAKVLPNAIVTVDGAVHDVDAIIFASGFDVQPPPVTKQLHGRGELSLGEQWEQDPAGYLTCFSGFPNMFMLFSLFSLVACGGFRQAELQAGYVIDAIQTMRRNGLGAFDVRVDVQQAFADEMHRKLSRSVWERGGCTSFYLDSKGRVMMAYPGTTWSLRRRMSRFDIESYATVPLSERNPGPASELVGTKGPGR